MKLINILKEIISEGVTRNSNGNLNLKPNNHFSDLLLTTNGDTQREGNTVYYTFEYNPEYEDGKAIKKAADDIKDLKNINKDELYNITLSSIRTLFSKTFTPDVVYYLGSSRGLSKFIAQVIQDNYPKIEILPLNKKTFPSWQNMLVDNYKELTLGPKQLTRAENAAKKMWNAEKGKIKSSGYDVQMRKFFKSKYELEKILSREKMLFIDDNVQQGIDFSFIKNHIPEVKQLAFYTSIVLPREGATVTKASKTVKEKFCLKNRDPEYFKLLTSSTGNTSLYVSSKHPEISFLKKKLKVDNVPQNIGGISYYKFKPDTKITSIDSIPKCK